MAGAGAAGVEAGAAGVEAGVFWPGRFIGTVVCILSVTDVLPSGAGIT